MASLCSSFVKSTGRPCCRPVIDFSSHCGYHVPNKKQRTFRQPKPLEECAICYTNMLHSQPRQTCGHRFHDRCIVRWFQTGHNTCPLCRSVLSEDTLSDHEHDPTYTPVHEAAGAVQGSARGAVHGAAGAVHNVAAHEAIQGEEGSSLHNPILIEDDDVRDDNVHEDVLGVNFVPDTPLQQHQRLPTPRRIVFDDQDQLNTIIHNAIDQRLRILFP